MTAEASSSSSRAAAAATTETRVFPCCDASIQMEEIDRCSPCSVRVHAHLIISREYHRIGDVCPKAVHDEDGPLYEHRRFEHWMEVKDPSLFRSYVSCRDLIHGMLAEALGTRDYDLAPDNWDDFQPHEIATKIVADVRRDTTIAFGLIPAYAINIVMDLLIRLIYSEPKALLLACKEEAAAHKAEPAGALTRGRKRRRREAGGGELCAICFSDVVETQEEETVRLPCSHAFHRRCIPTCRRDSLEFFGSVDRRFLGLGHVIEDEN